MESSVTPSHLTLNDLERSNSRSLRFWNFVSCKGAELGHMVLLNINKKPYMGSPMTLYYIWPWVTLERLISRLLRFQRLICHKAAVLGHMLLLNTNGESYMGIPKPPSHLTLSDIERSKLSGEYDLKLHSSLDFSIDLACSSEFLIQVCRKLPMSYQLQLWSRAEGPWTSCFIFYRKSNTDHYSTYNTNHYWIKAGKRYTMKPINRTMTRKDI